MGLFQKKPTASVSLPYNIGATSSILVIGLGNPGEEYSGTRHNIGFEVLDRFATKSDFPAWSHKKDLSADITLQTIGSSRVILAKPSTFMNLSGQAATALQHFYKLDNSVTLVIYDEFALPFGSIRARVGGESAGHNGIKSLIEHIGNDFNRLRVGIGSERAMNSADFVLKQFSKEEKLHLEPIIKETVAMANEFIASGQLPHETRTVI